MFSNITGISKKLDKISRAPQLNQEKWTFLDTSPPYTRLSDASKSISKMKSLLNIYERATPREERSLLIPQYPASARLLLQRHRVSALQKSRTIAATSSRKRHSWKRLDGTGNGSGRTRAQRSFPICANFLSSQPVESLQTRSRGELISAITSLPAEGAHCEATLGLYVGIT